MDSARPGYPPLFLTLQQAAQSLAVSIDVLISWNDHNILKPTITPTGEIGYSKTQIDQFIAIRSASALTARENLVKNMNQFSQSTPLPFQEIKTSDFQNVQNHSTNNFSQINNYNFYTNPNNNDNGNGNKNKITISLVGLGAGFLFLVIGIFGIFLLQENKLNALVLENKISKNEDSKILAANTYNFDEKTNLTEIERMKEREKSKLKNEGQALTQNRETILNNAFEEDEENASIKETYKDQVTLLRSILGKGSEEEIRSGIRPDTDVSTYSQTANFDTSTNCPDCDGNSDTENNVFDTEGNIKVSKEESEENKLLASNLALGGINQSFNPVRQSPASAGLVSVFILGLITFYFAYTKKHLLFSTHGSENLGHLSLTPAQKTPALTTSKLIELFQKTDGTVVLFLQGKEFKISKPEMESESDKLIERLLQLVGSDLKEIEYDILLDDKILVNTPLSKLVTRLGFVGIKRELFFPRTSKTKVHFRKYLTAEDLMAMNLTINDITDGFNSLN